MRDVIAGRRGRSSSPDACGRSAWRRRPRSNRRRRGDADARRRREQHASRRHADAHRRQRHDALHLPERHAAAVQLQRRLRGAVAAGCRPPARLRATPGRSSRGPTGRSSGHTAGSRSTAGSRTRGPGISRVKASPTAPGRLPSSTRRQTSSRFISRMSRPPSRTRRASRDSLPPRSPRRQIAAQHAALAAKTPDNLDAMKMHAGHVIHAVDPGVERTGPGLGFGVRRAAAGVVEHIQLAAKVPNVSANCAHAGLSRARIEQQHVRRSDEIVAVAQRIRAAATAAERLRTWRASTRWHSSSRPGWM